jgi:hypothetical protein
MTQASEAAQRQTFRLSKRLSVEMTAGLAGFSCEWAPAKPARLTAKELRRYRAARAVMAARLAEATGKRVLVIEL